jgi:nucleotide-binding universal stress UspA family protein
MFKKILVPLDGSELAEYALKQALNLAHMISGEVILVHAIPPKNTQPHQYEQVWHRQSLEQARPAALRYLQAVRASYQTPDIALRPQVIEEDEASAIVDTAEAEAADLIVMSSHGRSGITRWALGSVTEKVLHGASCPVMIIRSAEPIYKILITLDGSELAERALAPGLEVARCLGARVMLLHVNPLLPIRQLETAQFDWIVGTGPEAQQLAKIQDRSAAYLERIAHSYQPYAGREIETTVEIGLAANTILKFTASHQFDLIAMSTHGRTGLNRWLYGSVTTKVLHGSHCSMLIVRPPAHALN